MNLTAANNYLEEVVSLIRNYSEAGDGLRTVCLKIAGLSIRLFFTQKSLEQKIMPAFRYLVSNRPEGETLDIYLMESASTGVCMPETPWRVSGDMSKGDMWVSDTPELKVKHQPALKSLLMYAPKENTAVYWVDNASGIPYYESSAPLRPILHWWASLNGMQLLHAAAVGIKNAGVLVVGKGGSGKSNTAVSCLNSNLKYVADDYCLLSFDNEPIAHNLFATAKLEHQDVDRYPWLKPVQYRGDENEIQDEKALFFLYPEFKTKLIPSFPIKALIVPLVTNTANAKLVEISGSEAYLALAPSTIFQLHGSRVKTHENVSRLLKEMPCYRLELSTDSTRNVAAISALLREKLSDA